MVEGEEQEDEPGRPEVERESSSLFQRMNRSGKREKRENQHSFHCVLPSLPPSLPSYRYRVASSSTCATARVVQYTVVRAKKSRSFSPSWETREGREGGRKGGRGGKEGRKR